MIRVSAVRVLIIDNSIYFRDELADGLRQHLPPGSLVEKTSDPVDALEKIPLFHPDVIVLNYAMSPIQINKQRLLTLLTEQQDIPIVAFGLMSKDLTHTAQFGIAYYIKKPTDSEISPAFYRSFAIRIEQVLGHRMLPPKENTSWSNESSQSSTARATSLAPGAIMTRASWQKQRITTTPPASPSAPLMPAGDAGAKIELIAIGSSTGGTEAISAVLKDLRPPLPGIVITQHIPPLFAKLFAKRLDDECALHVKEGVDGERVENNTVYIAPGNLHMTVRKSGDAIMIGCHMGPKVHSCRPSVDVLFKSVATNIGAAAAGVILTGMGHDGAEGLLKMRHAGSPTIGQDEATCVVYGMPRAAWDMGAVEQQLPLGSIASAITQLAHR